jgi:uncharacterized repeat protein (TIGR02543 family)
MKILGANKNTKLLALVCAVAMLGMTISVSAQASDDRSKISVASKKDDDRNKKDDDRNKKDDRTPRVIELKNPSGVVITPTPTSLAISFNVVAYASSYTVRIFQGTSGEKLVGSPRILFNPGDSVSGLTPSTDYRVSVQAIGDKTRYSNSDDPRKVSVRTSPTPVNTPFNVTWNSNCLNGEVCTPASSGTNFYLAGDRLTPPTSDPLRPGFTFTGWQSLNTAVAPTASSTPNPPYADLTFLAQWTPKTYTVTWNSNCLSGEVCPPASGGTATYTAGQSITPPSNPSRPGFAFISWTSSNSVVAPTASSTPISPFGNIIFTAQWTPNSVQSGGNGLSQESAGLNAFQIKRDFPSSPDGLYWIKNSNINSGLPFQIYADMTGAGGGWTLIFANAAQGADRAWTNQEVQSINSLLAPSNPKDLSALLGKYSILNFADHLKSSMSGFQYRIDANDFERYGGVWTANQNYSFNDVDNNLKMNITLNTKWDLWEYNNSGIEQLMPYPSTGCGKLTTSENACGEWWGSLAASDASWQPAPWIASIMPNPQSIWYWVR